LLVVGLTGGIASGKSTVCTIFRDAGAIIIDADILARQVVIPGSRAWQGIKSAFGGQVIGPDGDIDRDLLGRIVFSDPGLRKRLESIVHPRVRERIESEIACLRESSPDALVIEDVPLLFEAGMAEGLDEIIVVYSPVNLQVQRLMRRDGIELEAAQARIASQLPMEDKRRRATIVIDNSDDLSLTAKQTIRLYDDLSQRARRNC